MRNSWSVFLAITALNNDRTFNIPWPEQYLKKPYAKSGKYINPQPYTQKIMYGTAVRYSKKQLLWKFQGNRSFLSNVIVRCIYRVFLAIATPKRFYIIKRFHSQAIVLRYICNINWRNIVHIIKPIIMIKTQILLWKTIEGNKSLRVRVWVRFLLFYSEFALTDQWCNTLQTLLGRKIMRRQCQTNTLICIKYYRVTDRNSITV